MKNYFILFLLFTACTENNNTTETTKAERTVSFATSLSADENKINQLYLYANPEGEGYVKLIHFGHKVQHLGNFVEDPNGKDFSFSIAKSLSTTVMKSEKYEDYYLNVINDTKGKDLKLKVHYEALNKDINENEFMFTTLMLVNIDNFQNINSITNYLESKTD